MSKYTLLSTKSGERLNDFLTRTQDDQNFLKWKKAFYYKDTNRRTAWVKYYDELRNNHYLKAREYELMKKLTDNYDLSDENDSLATNIQNEIFDMVNKLKEEIECCICLEAITNRDDLVITNCGHKYCKTCRKKIDKCALCRKKLGKYRDYKK
tara:strand:+ start:24129 stop:24587 length:459 start_codon:yes stop_codon:yes gene_type:complete